MDTTLDGTVALVTGASSGIGEAIARRLAAAGSAVALVARRVAELDRVQAEIERAGGTARSFTADLLLDADADRMLARVEDQLGVPDILVNNTGEISYSPVHEMDFARWDDFLWLSLRTPAYLCARILPSMRERRRGYIVNIASEAGCFVYAGLGAYCVSKHGCARYPSWWRRRTRTSASRPGRCARAHRHHGGGPRPRPRCHRAALRRRRGRGAGRPDPGLPPQDRADTAAEDDAAGLS